MQHPQRAVSVGTGSHTVAQVNVNSITCATTERGGSESRVVNLE